MVHPPESQTHPSRILFVSYPNNVKQSTGRQVYSVESTLKILIVRKNDKSFSLKIIVEELGRFNEHSLEYDLST